MDQILGQIILFAGNFAPANYFPCDGRLLPISGYTALFSILGNTYGGDGRTNFALPNLSGSGSCSAGQGPGLTTRALGENFGSNSVTLTIPNLPQHSHEIKGAIGVAVNDTDAEDSDTPENAYLRKFETDTYAAEFNSDMGVSDVTFDNCTPVGNNIPFSIVPPSLVMTYCIAWNGIFPQRPS